MTRTIQTFDAQLKHPRSQVLEIFPNVHRDDRGSFSEVMSIRTQDIGWIQQVNRSESVPGVVRGLHAQMGKHCQGKLVECPYGRILDIVVDARPDSSTFGTAGCFLLDDERQNKVWIPRGFLHGFASLPSKDRNVFQYFVDNLYEKESEICVNPNEVVMAMLERQGLEAQDFILSEKDRNGIDMHNFMSSVKSRYEDNGELWYIQ